MKPTYVIYHSADNDGLCCREIARHFLGPDAVLIGLDYNEPAPFIPDDATLYILDLSVPSLMAHPGLIWIDHHKTAIEQFPASIPGYRIDGVAACRLAWQWFSTLEVLRLLTDHADQADTAAALPGKQEYLDRTVNEPLAVRLIGENDIWDHRDPRVALFGAGLDSQEINWQLLLDAKLRVTTPYAEDLLRDGVPVAYSRRKRLRRLIEEGAFTLVFEGLRFLAINAAGLSSHAYDLHPEAKEHDAGLSFTWSPKIGRWKVSMRAIRPGLDLTPLAKKFGGGGHPAACGFSCDFLPFEPFTRASIEDAAIETRMGDTLRAVSAIFPGRPFAVIVFAGKSGQGTHIMSNGRPDDTRRSLRRVVASLATGASDPELN